MAKIAHRNEPDWAHRARHIDHKPEWQDEIPHELYGLGKVFFPIPPRQKGWPYPHHMDEYRYEPDSEILNAYFDSGWGYGVACDGDLIVLDIDDKSFIDEIIEYLPETVYQWTGSGEGIHLFYICEGITRRHTLKDVIWACPDCRETTYYDGGKDICEVCGWDRPQPHIGELKADPNGYVVGPGSVHPSGNIYGPLKGDSIATVTEEELNRAIRPYYNTKDRKKNSTEQTKDYSHYGNKSSSQFYSLTADDVMPWLGYGERISHPVHGSDTGSNFMKNDQGKTFVCWRCTCGFGNGCVISAQHLLAMIERPNEYGSHACEEVRGKWRNDSTLHCDAWKQAVKQSLVHLRDIPYTVLKGFMVETGAIDEEDNLPDRHQATEQLIYEMQAELRDDVTGRWEDSPPSRG